MRIKMHRVFDAGFPYTTITYIPYCSLEIYFEVDVYMVTNLPTYMDVGKFCSIL